MRVFVKLTHPNARVPCQSRSGDVGFDLYPVEDVTLEKRSVTKVHTGVYLADEPPRIESRTTFLKIEGRSGLALKGVFPVGGIVDPTYRGELVVLLHNSASDDYVIEKGKACAQLVLYSVLTSDDGVVFVSTDESKSSVRGESGFGSSDK